MADHALHRDTVPSRVGGRYVLRDELGRGGMASVHRAHDEVLDREVAVKLLHAHLATDPTFLDRFRREARAAAALSHPNVVTVHDWGETDDGAYLVLQLIEGVSLRDVLRVRSHLPVDEAVAVLAPVAAGLGAAHAAGLVHRDVKPENLLLGRDGTVRVTDFGLARAAASATSTFGGEVLIGSPHYLAPEAVRSEPVDARADVYGLGIVLYESLVGEPPHQADTPFATAMAHLERAIPAPSSRRPQVPTWLDDVVATATAFEPDDRYPDAAAFGRTLSRGAGGDAPDVSGVRAAAAAAVPVHQPASSIAPGGGSSPPPPPPPSGADDRGEVPHRSTAQIEEEEAPPRRRRRWLWLLTLLLLLGGAAGGYAYWDRIVAPVTEIPDVTGQPLDAARDQLTSVGFEVSIDPERPTDVDVPEDHVLSQEPAETARLGTDVTLLISAGPAQVEVPDVVGADVDDARAAMESLGFEVDTTERHDEDVAEGHVVATDPGPQDTADEASTVLLVVSLGPTPIEVPDLVGIEVDAARAEVLAAGLELEVAGSDHDPDVPEGHVLSQSPGPDDTLTRDGVVEVVVSDGPELVTVPLVRGESAEDAVAELEDLGFEVEIREGDGSLIDSFLNRGRVLDQDPASEVRRPRGDTVIIYVQG